MASEALVELACGPGGPGRHHLIVFLRNLLALAGGHVLLVSALVVHVVVHAP